MVQSYRPRRILGVSTKVTSHSLRPRAHPKHRLLLLFCFCFPLSRHAQLPALWDVLPAVLVFVHVPIGHTMITGTIHARGAMRDVGQAMARPLPIHATVSSHK